MRPANEFAGLDRAFWAHVKFVSERLKYSERGKRGSDPKKLRRYSMEEVVASLKEVSISNDHNQDLASGARTEFHRKLTNYLNYRADILEQQVAPNLMDRNEASALFSKIRRQLKPKCALPMNKQKGKKRHHAYLVGIVNMLTEKALGGRSFDDEPRGLTIVTKDGTLLRTLSRWMDGAYPSRVNPYAIWEVKEYYGTTTFGSRVADGIYETMLDGEEMAELELRERRKVYHYLMVDDRYTWWDCGRSYLCRIIDLLHFGLVDEVLFGREIMTRWPEIVKTWP